MSDQEGQPEEQDAQERGEFQEDQQDGDEQANNQNELAPEQQQQEEQEQEQGGENNNEDDNDPRKLVNADETENDQNANEQGDHEENNPESEEDRLIREREERISKLAEKRALPTRKDEAIQYLFERLQEAETAIFDMHQVIKQESKKKAEILSELQIKTEQLNTLLSQEQATIKEKVAKELDITLEFALNRNAATQKEKEDAIEELNQQRKSNNEIKAEVEQLELKISEKNAEIADFKGQVSRLTEENNQLKEEKQAASQKAESQRIQELEDELASAKTIIQQLSDVRSALTKFNDKQKQPPDSSRIPGQQYQRNQPETSQSQANQEPPDSFWYLDHPQSVGRSKLN